MIASPESRNGSSAPPARGLLAVARDKLAERFSHLIVAGGIMLAFVVFGALSASAAASGWLVMAAWAVLVTALRASAQTSGAAALRDAERAAHLDSMRVAGALVRSLPDPAIILGRDGAVLTTNAAADEIFQGAGKGRHISQMTRAPELLTAVEDALHSETVQSCRLDYKVPVERTLVGTVAPLQLPGETRDDPHLLIVLRDLTEQDRLVRMRADFVANASHELRTPLASLKGFVETLQDAAKDDAGARERFLKIMQQQAERMARLIDDLLSLSRIEMKAHVMPREYVDIASIVTHVAQTLTPIADEKQIEIELGAIPAGDVAGDRDELIQVFQNLIENAVKYGRKGGHVRINGRVMSGRVPGAKKLAVEITDDGPGIAPEHLPRLTERFYRVNAAQSRHVGGTGLGLAIVKHVLNRHQAELQVDSAVGKGSTFRVMLPLRP